MEVLLYTFGEFEVDEACFEIRRHGSRIHLEPRVYDFVMYLLRHRDRVVTKNELVDKVWAGDVVADAVLARCASVARRALGDHSVIRTIYRRGYQFGANVSQKQRVEDRGVDRTGDA